MQSLHDDFNLIFNCAWHSLILLITGYAIGAVLGVISGVLIGWSSKWRYWGMPMLKVIGPIPATAFIPLALMLFPTAFTSAVSLITMAVWFPVTMLTTSGIANVRVPLLDVARTLGARPAFLVFRVAIPAAMPSIFVGLFMGLGASFLTLIVAETVGVTSGLGWYMNWAKAWADYPKVYAALVIMAFFFSGIMTLLFKVRDRVLVYQKGTIKW
jgi:NitT/TauT family transport system permease protein